MREPKLLAISRKQFRTLSQVGLEGVEAYRTQKKVFGQTRTIVLTFNQNLYDGQLQGLTAHLAGQGAAETARPANPVATPPRRQGEGRLFGDN